MKRLAVLALTAGVGLAGRAAAGDPIYPGLPAPTGLAATAPQVPAPYTAEPAAGAVRFRDRFGGGRPATAPGEPLPGPFSGISGLFHRKPKEYVAGPYDPYPAKKGWCETCAPSARQPLPALPAGPDMGAYRVRRASAVEAPPAAPPAPPPAPPAAAGCPTGHCGVVADRHSGSCWDCFKRWVCYRYTPVKLPHVPTQRDAPQWTYGTCREGPRTAAGCAGGTCATGPIGGHAGRVKKADGCAPCPVPGDAVMPGYRLANPELHGVSPQRAAGPVVSPVVPAGYKPQPPAPAVPYKGGTTPNQRPFIGQ